MAPDREGGACGSAVILLSSSSTRPRYTIMADGPRCQRRKQTKPRRNNAAEAKDVKRNRVSVKPSSGARDARSLQQWQLVQVGLECRTVR
ncbi:zinc finger E-box-binding homeobox 1 isoform X1 [Tachysurus ichikawai]